jgi:hypothetical protein
VYVLESARDSAHSQRVITTKRERERPLLRVFAHSLRDGLAYAAHQPRVLQDTDGRVVGRCNRLELVVAVELNLPSEPLELIDESGLDEVNWTSVYTRLRLFVVSVLDS